MSAVVVGERLRNLEEGFLGQVGDVRIARGSLVLRDHGGAVLPGLLGLPGQAGERLAAGDDWQDTGLVFTNHVGAALDAGNVRKMFKRICTEAGVGDSWTPRELRTTFVSLMSHQGVAIEEIHVARSARQRARYFAQKDGRLAEGLEHQTRCRQQRTDRRVPGQFRSARETAPSESFECSTWTTVFDGHYRARSGPTS